MEDQAGRSWFADLLKRPVGQTDMGAILEALPAGIPYIGDIYSDVRSASELQAVERNLASAIEELKKDISRSAPLLTRIASELALHGSPQLHLGADGCTDQWGDPIALLSFTLSNARGGIVQVRRVALDLVGTVECPEFHALPGAKGNGIENHKWHLRLNPGVTSYTLGHEERKFGPGDIDRFTLTVSAEAHLQFYVQLVVEHRDVTATTWTELRSPVYRLHLSASGPRQALQALARAWAHAPDLLACEPPFRGREGITRFYDENAEAFIALPELLPALMADPDDFLASGLQGVIEYVRWRIAEEAVIPIR